MHVYMIALRYIVTVWIKFLRKRSKTSIVFILVAADKYLCTNWQVHGHMVTV